MVRYRGLCSRLHLLGFLPILVSQFFEDIIRLSHCSVRRACARWVIGLQTSSWVVYILPPERQTEICEMDNPRVTLLQDPRITGQDTDPDRVVTENRQ